eukprot:Gb_34708 [translate_table: standard]
MEDIRIHRLREIMHAIVARSILGLLTGLKYQTTENLSLCGIITKILATNFEKFGWINKVVQASSMWKKTGEEFVKSSGSLSFHLVAILTSKSREERFYRGGGREGYSVDPLVYEAIIHCLGSAHRFEKMREVFKEIQFINWNLAKGAFLSMIRSYMNAHVVEEALRILTRNGEFGVGVHLDVKTFNILIKALCKANQMDSAFGF